VRGILMAGEASDLVKRADDFIDAFNVADWQRFTASLATDVVYEETGTQRRAEGVDAYLALSKGWKQAFPDVRGTIRNAIASGHTVVQEITWEGTHTGPLEGPGGPLPPSGKSVTVPAAFWVIFGEDKIQELHHYLDVFSLMQQLDVIPTPGTAT